MATPHPWNWPCPQPLTQPMKSFVFKAFQSHQRFKADFRAPKSIFEKCFKIISYVQIWVLVTFWMSQSDCEHICDPLEAFGDIWRKTNFSIFLIFFKQFWLDFGLKMKEKWTWKIQKCEFSKNEALHWKSASVKVLDYMLSLSDDCDDPPHPWNWQCLDHLT